MVEIVKLTSVLVIFDCCFSFDAELTLHMYIVRPASSCDANSGDDDMTAYVIQVVFEGDKLKAEQE